MDLLLKLRSELDHAYSQYRLIQFIDDPERMIQEQSYWSKRIATIKEQMLEVGDDD